MNSSLCISVHLLVEAKVISPSVILAGCHSSSNRFNVYNGGLDMRTERKMGFPRQC